MLDGGQFLGRPSSMSDSLRLQTVRLYSEFFGQTSTVCMAVNVYVCVCVGGGRDKWLEERETDRLLAFIHVEQEFLTCYYSQSLFFDIMTAVWVTVTWKYGTDVMDMCVTG